MTSEKIQKIMELVRLYGSKSFFEGVYSDRTGTDSERRMAHFQNEGEAIQNKIQEALNEELEPDPQPGVCSGCGQRDVLCVCNQE